MYKLLLCWRYLRTRYIALVSIISVLLGVATMIVVNSVMEGFSCEMQNRIHGVLSDLVFKSNRFEGMEDAKHHEEEIRRIAGDDIEAMSPTVMTQGLLTYQCGGGSVSCPVDVFGIDAKTQGNVSDFGKYLQHPKNREAMSFELRHDGYDTRDHQADGAALERTQMERAGWTHRRDVAEAKELEKSLGMHTPKMTPAANVPADPFAGSRPAEGTDFDPKKQQYEGAVLGIAMVSGRTPSGEDRFYALPGDDVSLTFPNAALPPKFVSDNFTIVDLYESKMNEYDSKFVFLPLRRLQELRGMIDPETGIGRVNAITIRLRPGADGNVVRDKLRAAFPSQLYDIQTWRDMQGPLLSAVDMEIRILNVLLFMIIAVAGFGILAIFYMIVVEKTRDIGILKALGASSAGILGIFLGYGLLLGVVGSGIGLIIGLLFVWNINELADGLAWLTGKPVFDPAVYYFFRIPAIIVPQTVAWIVVGALAIAVAASILPARRAARLHPVEALRYE